MIYSTTDLLSHKFKRGIEEYMGRPISSVRIHEDPKVSDTWAIRAEDSEKNVHDFLVVFGHSNTTSRRASVSQIAELLEDCVFDEWPPATGPLRFF